MKKLFLALLAGIFCSGMQAETIKTKKIDDGGTGNFKAIAVKKSMTPLRIKNSDREIHGYDV